MKNSNAYYSIPEAARRFGVSRATMWKWVKSEKIKAIVTPGGHHRIMRRDLENLLAQSGVSQAAGPQPKTVLVVDDDRTVRLTLERYLTRADYQVETAPDGFKAGMKVQEFKPDLVILDIMMAGMDGFEVCRTIKANPDLKGTRVLIMTGFDTPENRARAMWEGADAYLPKHKDFKRVLEEIQALLGG